jgi:hypothetical protein
MSSVDPFALRPSKLFPPALIATIQDGVMPSRSAVLATARHVKRDLTGTDPIGISRRLAVRLGYGALTGCCSGLQRLSPKTAIEGGDCSHCKDGSIR